MKYPIIALIFAAFLAGCTSNPPAEEDHDHEEISLLFTDYNGEFEIFAEAVPFVTGSPSTILVHLTKLEGFKPASPSKVTASLIIGEKGIRQSSITPVSPGIFAFELTPVAAGTGRILFDIEDGDKSASFTFRDIEVFEEEEEALHAAEEHIVSDPNGIIFTKEQAWKMDFSTGVPELKPFGDVIVTSGIVETGKAGERVIAAGTKGVVTGLGNDLLPGAAIKAGTALFTVKGNMVADENSEVRYSIAKSNWETSGADYSRITGLYNERLVTESEFLAAKNRYESALSEYEMLRKNFGPGGQTIMSPVTGKVTELLVSNGEIVASGQPLLTVSTGGKSVIKAQLRQKHVPDMANIDRITIVSPVSGEPIPGIEDGINIIGSSGNVNPSTGMCELFVETEKSGHLLPGTVVQLYLTLKGIKESVVIPNSSIVEEQGLFFVFIQLTPELFVKREIVRGGNDGASTEVLGGVAPGERIVTRGALYVKLAQSSGALDPHAGHVH